MALTQIQPDLFLGWAEADDYDPEYAPTANSFDTITYSVQSGLYRRVDDLVFVSGRLTTSALTVGSGTGLRVTLPFTVDAVSGGGLTIGNRTDFTTNPDAMRTVPGSALAILLKRATFDADDATMDESDLATGSGKNVLFFSGWYVTSD